MGYADTEQVISVERAEQLRDKVKTAPHTRWSFGRQTWEDAMVSEAVGIWRDEEANRYDGERAGEPRLLTAVPEEVLGWYIDSVTHDESFIANSYITPVVSEASVATKTRTVKVKVSGDVIAKLRRGSYHGQAELRKLLHSDFPVTELGKIEVVTLPAPRKPAASATAGKAKTVYRIRGVENHFTNLQSIHAALNKSYDSQADARAAAIDLMSEHEDLPDMRIEAVVVREQEDGKLSPSLVTIARPVADGTVTVQVTTHTVKPSPKLKNYRVRFAYHH
jgi:hypothetical protein